MLDILQMIAFCQRELRGVSADAFAESERLQLAVQRALEIVSEASRYLPDAFKAETPQVPWRQVADFGNFVRHAYHGVDAGLIYRTATVEVFALKGPCEVLYEQVKRPTDPWPDIEG